MVIYNPPIMQMHAQTPANERNSAIIQELIADNDLSAVNSNATIVLNSGTSHSFL